MKPVEALDAALIAKAKKVALGAWLCAVVFGALSLWAKSAGLWTLGTWLYALCFLSALVFVVGVLFRMVAAIILLATSVGGRDDR